MVHNEEILLYGISINISLQSSDGKKIELYFWFSSGFNAKEYIMEMVDENNKVQSDTTVNAVFQGLYEKMEMKMHTAAVTRLLPDVAQERFEYLDLYIDEGLLTPIDNEISAGDREDVFDKMWAAVIRNGSIYGIPFCVNTYIFSTMKLYLFRMARIPYQSPQHGRRLSRLVKNLQSI